MNIFELNINLLEKLFSKEEVASKLPRLKEIYEYTESSWENNIKRFEKNKIKYLLIAEAPPWSEHGIPKYFYNQIRSSYHSRIWKVFFSMLETPSDPDTSYQLLVNKKFLLIDSLPYAMNYSGKRNRSVYNQLVSHSIAWWQQKLENHEFLFEDKIKVAFAFKINGLSIINALNGHLKLSGQIIKLDEGLIAADKSGYTNSDKLRSIFNIVE